MVAPCSLKILSMITIPRLFPSFLVEKYGWKIVANMLQDIPMPLSVNITMTSLSLVDPSISIVPPLEIASHEFLKNWKMPVLIANNPQAIDNFYV
jgi:hypothetical protein